MTVAELMEEPQRPPAHWPVTVEVEYNEGIQSVREVLLHRTLDVQSGNFPTQGNMAIIRLGDS